MPRPFTPTGALRARYSILVVLITAIVISVAGVFYTNYVQRQSDQRWCALLATIDAPEAPPTTERGRRVQAQIHGLVRDFNCKEG